MYIIYIYTCRYVHKNDLQGWNIISKTQNACKACSWPYAHFDSFDRMAGLKLEHCLMISQFSMILGSSWDGCFYGNLLFQSTFTLFLSPACYVRIFLNVGLGCKLVLFFQMFFLPFWIPNPYPSNATNAPTRSISFLLKQLQIVGQRHHHFCANFKNFKWRTVLPWNLT